MSRSIASPFLASSAIADPRPRSLQSSAEASDGMYSTDEPRSGVGFYGSGGGGSGLTPLQQQQVMAESGSEEQEVEVRAPKKRAETWVQEETRSLIALRRELDGLFSTSKSNKHLWEEISRRMREKGFARSPAMCTEKWRNLLKDFKKFKHGAGPAKMSCYNEIAEVIKARNKSAAAASKVDTSYLQFSDKENHAPYGERVILVKWGDYSRKIGIDGTLEAIKEAIKSAFRLRTKRAFWLEDKDGVVRSIDRNMPLGTYTLHLDEGIKIKVRTNEVVHTEELTFYTEDDFRDFLVLRGLASLRQLGSFTGFHTLDDLCPGAIYHGERSWLGE